MPQVGAVLTPEAIAKLGTMELRARAIVEGHFSGQHRSPYRGASVEFADHREYNPGDETRHIDWKVYGRRERLFVKQYDAETNMSVHLLVDASRSMDYGEPLRKLDYAACLAAGLAYLATRQRDAVSLTVFDSSVRLALPPRTKPAHLQQVFDALEQLQPGEQTNVAGALESVAQTLRRRGLIVLISDLLDDVEPIMRALGYFRHRGHDVIVLQVMDPTELRFDIRGYTLFEDLESRERLASDPRRIRGAYLKALREFLAAVRDGCTSRHIDHELLDTSRPFDTALTAYLARRDKTR